MATSRSRRTANAERRRDLDAHVAAQRRLAWVGSGAKRDERLALRDNGETNETVRTLEARIDHAELTAADFSRVADG